MLATDNESHQLWHGLDELPRSGGEFPPGAPEWPEMLNRRRFLQLMAASLALAGGNGCVRQPLEKIVPYTRQPEELVPGKPLYFATALAFGGYARGVLVESHEGRPTKIEGNPAHPASLGASDPLMQAEILTLYDPDRSQTVLRGGSAGTWDEFLGALIAESANWKANGAGLRVLSGHETSPTLLDQIGRLLAKFPDVKWHEHDPAMPEAPSVHYHFANADVIVSLGADFLASGPASLVYARDFASRRRVANGARGISRLYVAESSPSLTGAMADHRIVLHPAALAQFAQQLANAIEGGAAEQRFAGAIARDLRQHTGRSIVVAGGEQPLVIRDLAHRMNAALQNIGATVELLSAEKNGAHGFAELVSDMQRGAVETLIILGVNPVYDAPADLPFTDALAKVQFTAHLGLYADETASRCMWHIPQAHTLETWSDALAFNGVPTICQPLIEPLYGGRSPHELLAALLNEGPNDGYEIVRAFWQAQHADEDFEKFWRKSLHEGVIPDWKVSGEPRTSMNTDPGSSAFAGERATASGLHLEIRPSPAIYDGRFSNNGWLQELPQPLTQLTWDNAALVSPATARRLRLATADVAELKFRGRSVRAPVFVLPGQADECITIHLGYGRTRAGRIANGVGFNASALRTTDAPWGGPGLEISKTGETHRLATTQQHHSMEGRDLIRTATMRDGSVLQPDHEPRPVRDETLYRNWLYDGRAWGMVIDLSTCIGCSACVIACQAENNIPIVGKEQVERGREMHWIRVDRYFEGAAESPQIHHQPVPCMHCENAPCEVVCPVAATVHSYEGLNEMIYNRCIGTRYCSNNCPYKVRRFNFLAYNDPAPSLRLLRNPNVTVRDRGVIEKCTYCVQRIQAVKIESEKANRTIRDGEIVPACAQACPAEAIVFGDINDPQSRVAKRKASPLNYGLLSELNTRPRTTYLARARNPNPELEPA
jgi:Fe-S-cluster-containing dehydrogenase component